MYPKIHLAIDNCFAYKRWTQPEAWCQAIADLGVQYVEASADNELDPLFMGPEYLADWVVNVRRAQKATGVRVANLYSGHGTYSTLGMTHTDARVRRRMIDSWFKPMIEMAAELDCGFGFFAHAFPESVVQDPEQYAQYIGILEQGLIELNRYAEACGCGEMGIEQMYSPHQYPWTIAHTRSLLRTVTAQSGRPFYFTEDMGHHHIKFQRPNDGQLRKIIGNVPKGTWLGSDKAFALAADAPACTDEVLAAINAEMDNNPNLFATAKDGDCYAWLGELGCYSPIIHLQQTNGQLSAHLPFTAEQNSKGIIDGARFLRALKSSYDRPVEGDMPKRCADIYLTLELFAGTSSIMRDFMADYRESVEYWRQWVPRDGMDLNELVDRL